MLFSKSFLLTGVETSAAQNLPVTKTCSQCGAVLPSSVRACSFCDSSFSVGPSIWEDPSDISAKINLAVNAEDHGWRGAVSQRPEASQTLRRTPAPLESQAQIAF